LVALRKRIVPAGRPADFQSREIVTRVRAQVVDAWGADDRRMERVHG